jgi:hypothetical protein
MKKLMILIAGGFISACATGYNPSYYFNEVQVVNQAGATIQDVSLRVLDSPKMLNCVEVAKFAMCDDRFGKRLYPQQGIELSWIHPDGSQKSDTLNPDIPAFFSASFPLRIVIELREDGSVNTFYEQEEPGRDDVFVNG